MRNDSMGTVAGTEAKACAHSTGHHVTDTEPHDGGKEIVAMRLSSIKSSMVCMCHGGSMGTEEEGTGFLTA